MLSEYNSKMNILEEKQNPILKRKELKIIVKAEKNPSFQDAIKIISENFKSPEENIVIEKIKGKYGRKTFLINAKVYNSRQDKEKIEPKKKETETEKSAEQPVEQKPAENKPEEKQEGGKTE